MPTFYSNVKRTNGIQCGQSFRAFRQFFTRCESYFIKDKTQRKILSYGSQFLPSQRLLQIFAAEKLANFMFILANFVVSQREPHKKAMSTTTALNFANGK